MSDHGLEKGLEIRLQTARWGFPRVSKIPIYLVFLWWRGQDLNLRPSGYEPDELPNCSTPRCGEIIVAQIFSDDVRE